jgi:5-methylcytosine-specific restriction endonuclease McrA
MTTWTDQFGRVWKVPQIKGRLKFRSAGHAALKAFVIWRDGSRCRSCGCADQTKLIADHIVSRRNGGSHHPDNLQCLCEPCNARKSSLVDSKGVA